MSGEMPATDPGAHDAHGDAPVATPPDGPGGVCPALLGALAAAFPAALDSSCRRAEGIRLAEIDGYWTRRLHRDVGAVYKVSAIDCNGFAKRRDTLFAIESAGKSVVTPTLRSLFFGFLTHPK